MPSIYDASRSQVVFHSAPFVLLYKAIKASFSELETPAKDTQAKRNISKVSFIVFIVTFLRLTATNIGRKETKNKIIRLSAIKINI